MKQFKVVEIPKCICLILAFGREINQVKKCWHREIQMNVLEEGLGEQNENRTFKKESHF